MGLDALLKRLSETPETPDVSLDVSPGPAWIKAETPETCETCETCEKTITANDAELTRLVRICGEHYGFTEAEHVESLEIALADPASALICFSGIARKISPPAIPATTTIERTHP